MIRVVFWVFFFLVSNNNHFQSRGKFPKVVYFWENDAPELIAYR